MAGGSGVNRSSGIVDSFLLENDTAKLDGGKFGTSSVKSETVAPKGGFLREAFASVALFFKSLVGSRVSTPDAEPTDRSSGAKHLMSAMTKSNPNLTDVLVATSQFVKVGDMGTSNDVRMSELQENSKDALRNVLSEMDGHQLKRLESTFRKLPDLGVNMERLAEETAGMDLDEDQFNKISGASRISTSSSPH